jgi:hypothetical protein
MSYKVAKANRKELRAVEFRPGYVAADFAGNHHPAALIP